MTKSTALYTFPKVLIRRICLPLNPKDLTVNSPLWLIHISLQVSFKNLMSDQDNNFYLTSLIILITCLLANVWILEREVTG